MRLKLGVISSKYIISKWIHVYLKYIDKSHLPHVCTSMIHMCLRYIDNHVHLSHLPPIKLSSI